MRSLAIMGKSVNQVSLMTAAPDMLISPPLDQFDFMDFLAAKEIVLIGELALKGEQKKMNMLAKRFSKTEEKYAEV